MKGQLVEDPDLYKQMMSFEWAQFANDANTTLTILGVHSPEGSLIYLVFYTLVQNSIDEIDKRIAAVNSQLKTADKQLRAEIINEIADVVALAFVTGALLISFGEIGPGTAALMGLEAKLAASAAAIAASTKLVLDSLGIRDLIEFIANLRSTKAKLQGSVIDLKKARATFKDIV